MLSPEQGSQYYRGKLTRLWKESPMYHEAKRRAWVRVGVTKCEGCGDEVNSKLVEVDHIEPKMAPGQDPLNVALFAMRLNCPAAGLQTLCEGCHHTKTGKENSKRTGTRQKRVTKAVSEVTNEKNPSL